MLLNFLDTAVTFLGAASGTAHVENKSQDGVALDN